MKIKEGFIVRHLSDRTVVVAVGEASRDFNGIIRLNSTGEFLWKILENGADEKTLADALTAEYSISPETADADVKRFIEALEEAKLVV